MSSAAITDSSMAVEVRGLRLLAAEIVKWFHSGIVIFTAVGWALPWPQSWWLVLFLVPAMKLHWMTNGGICFLSTLECNLRRIPTAGTADQPGFLVRGAKFLLGPWSPSDEMVEKICEIGMYISWMFASARLFIM